MNIIVWYRRDLRVHDHAALWHACQEATQVIPLFILDPTHFANREVGSGRVQFLLDTLTDLDQRLRRQGSRLTLLCGRAEEVLPHFVQTIGADAVYYSTDIERWSGQLRDQTLAKLAAAEGWAFRPFLNYYVQTSGTYDREAWQTAWTTHSKEALYPVPNRIPTQLFTIPTALQHFSTVPTLADLGLPANQQQILPGGETAGHERMARFLTQRIATYRESISKPLRAEDDGTSHLSPYLKFGCISQRAAVQAARKKWTNGATATRKGLEAWASRLRWRDYFIQKFALYPQAEFINVYQPFDAIRRPDEANRQLLDAWRYGQTGYPLVDASMRALIETGWLNFRMRAMLATFLTFNLFQAWQDGAAWFMQHLLDGDATVDHWQWQMQAGITQPDRAYIRCYNPTKQCYDNDPDGAFIHRYVPALRNLPAPLCFEPWQLTTMEQEMYGVRIGIDYPAPVVDADATRQVAIDRVQPIRETVAAQGLVNCINTMAGVSPLVTVGMEPLEKSSLVDDEELE